MSEILGEGKAESHAEIGGDGGVLVLFVAGKKGHELHGAVHADGVAGGEQQGEDLAHHLIPQ